MLVQEGRAQLRVLTTVKSVIIPPALSVNIANKPKQDGDLPLDYARQGSSTHALLTEMELVGADEQELVKSAAKRFRPALKGAAGTD